MKMSVIYASLPNRNPGMISVNMAFKSWLRWSGISADISEYQLGKRYSNLDSPPATELLGMLDEAMDSDVVVYWGDWLQMNRYHEDLARTYHRGQWVDARPSHPQASLEETKQIVRKHLLLEGRPVRDLNKTLLIGGTLVLSSPSDFALPSYAESLKQLISHSALVLMRDLPSANITRTMRGTHSDDSCCGCDCAMLLDPCIAERPFESPKENGGTATAFLGRNLEARSSQYVSFVRDLCASAQVDPSWIDWFPYRRNSQRFIPRALNRLQQEFEHRGLVHAPVREEKAGVSFGALLGLVADSQFTITDTYHLAVNSWSLGIPAICIADTIDPRAWSINSGARHTWRDKRYEFYSMIGAMPYFVHARELTRRATRNSRLRQLTQLLLNGSDQKFLVTRRIAQIRDRTRVQIREAIGMIAGIEKPG